PARVVVTRAARVLVERRKIALVQRRRVAQRLQRGDRGIELAVDGGGERTGGALQSALHRRVALPLHQEDHRDSQDQHGQQGRRDEDDEMVPESQAPRLYDERETWNMSPAGPS